MILKPGYNGTITYTYDNNGNTIEKRTPTETTTYTYDFENRLLSATINGQSTNYAYDGDGNRVSKTDSSSTTNYLIDSNNNTGFAQVLAEFDGSGSLIVSYTYGDDLISQERSGVVSYFHYDGLGSTRNLTDSSGTTTDSYWYYAFGELLNKTGTTPNNCLFTGEQFDKNLRFYYLRARYYNPEIGRFITADPVEGNIYEPLSLHKYLYANLDPVNKIDPSGEQWISTTTLLYISTVISLCTTAIAINIGVRRPAKAPDDLKIYKLTRDMLEEEYWKIYNRLKGISIEEKRWYRIALTEITFDTRFYTGPEKEQRWIYEGKIYTGNEINYIGIGMFEAWLGHTLEEAKRKTFLWKFIMYWQKPTEGTIKWLEEGYKKYKQMEAQGK